MAKKPESSPSASEVARRIWLAGIGAYGKAFTDAQESLAKVGEDTSRRFEELVTKGEEIEDTFESKRNEVMEKMPTQSFALDDRIKEMRERLGLVIPASGTSTSDTSSLEERLDRLEEKVDFLIEQMQVLVKAPAKKKAATARTSKKTS